MAKPKGPEKKPVLIRLLTSTWVTVEREAKKRNMAVPTYLGVVIEDRFGSKKDEQPSNAKTVQTRFKGEKS